MKCPKWINRVDITLRPLLLFSRQSGLDEKLFAGHSLRAGFLTSAAGKGASIFKMMDVLRRVAWRCGASALVDFGSLAVYLCGSHFACRFQRPSKKWVLRFLRKGNQLIAIETVDLKPVSYSADFLSKDARATRASDFDLVVDHGETFQIPVKVRTLALRKREPVCVHKWTRPLFKKRPPEGCLPIGALVIRLGGSPNGPGERGATPGPPTLEVVLGGLDHQG